MLTKLIINGKINLHIEECMPSTEYRVLFIGFKQSEWMEFRPSW